MFKRRQQFQTLSIFELFTDTNGQKKLVRLCDFTPDRTFSRFEYDSELPEIFENHAVLDGNEDVFQDLDDGQVIFLRWQARPDKNDINADVVTKSDVIEQRPIEVVYCESAKNHDDIVSLLLEQGIRMSKPGGRVLFIATDNSGLLFEQEDLSELDEEHVFLEDVPLTPLLIKHISERQLVKCGRNRFTNNLHTFFAVFDPSGDKYPINQSLDLQSVEKSHKGFIPKLFQKKRQELKTSRNEFDAVRHELAETPDETRDNHVNISSVNNQMNSIFVSERQITKPLKSKTKRDHTRGKENILQTKELDNYEDTIYSVAEVFDDLFVHLDKDFSFMLAHFFYMIYLRRLSLLLAGPDGMKIAEAFSSVVTGKTPDVLECYGDFKPEVLERAFANTDSILVVTTPFNGVWFEQLILKIAQGTKTVFLISPFVGDLRIEPEGLFDYVVPLATEAFIKDIPPRRTTNIVGVRSNNYEEYEYVDEKDEAYEKIAQDLNIRRRLRSVASSIMTNALHELKQQPEKRILYYCVLSLYPYAVMTGQREIFDKIVQDHKIELRSKAVSFFEQL